LGQLINNGIEINDLYYIRDEELIPTLEKYYEMSKEK
jgi:hypothetical protein